MLQEVVIRHQILDVFFEPMEMLACIPPRNPSSVLVNLIACLICEIDEKLLSLSLLLMSSWNMPEVVSLGLTSRITDNQNSLSKHLYGMVLGYPRTIPNYTLIFSSP